MKRTYHRMSDDSPSLLRRLAEAEAAIRERRFRPWHAADLLDAAEVLEERQAAVAKIVRLVAEGYEGRIRDVRAKSVPDLRRESPTRRGRRASGAGAGRGRGRAA